MVECQRAHAKRRCGGLPRGPEEVLAFDAVPGQSALPHDKARLLDLIRQRVREDLATLERSHETAAQGVTHADARQEGDKDMRATEASYVARGQARRVVELQEALASLEALRLRAFGDEDPAALGALVTIELETGDLSCFVLPAAGGLQLDDAGRKVRVVTPHSPVGQALLGRTSGDEVTWQTPQGDVEGVITELR